MANKNPKTMSLSLRVLARLLSYPDEVLREHLDEMRQALRHEAALQPGTPGRGRGADRQHRGAERHRRRGRLRAALRQRPAHQPAPVRACARRFARPRPGDDRPGPDLRGRRAVPGRRRDARPPAGGAGVRIDAAAARGARLPGRDGAHLQRHLQRAGQAPQPLRQRARRTHRAGRRDGAAGERARRSPDRRDLVRAGGLRRLQLGRTGRARASRNRSRSSASTTRQAATGART